MSRWVIPSVRPHKGLKRLSSQSKISISPLHMGMMVGSIVEKRAIKLVCLQAAKKPSCTGNHILFEKRKRGSYVESPEANHRR